MIFLNFADFLKKSALSKWRGRFFAFGYFVMVLVRLQAASVPEINMKTGVDFRDSKQQVTLHGDKLVYDHLEQGMVVTGEGNVYVQMDNMRLFADHVVVDMASNRLKADGRVVWHDGGNTVYAGKIDIDLETQNGEILDLMYHHKDWIAIADRAEKKGEKEVYLYKSQATSCLCEAPQYRIVARELHLTLNERIRAHGVWLYIGVMPLLYVPYYTQSLKDPRPPIIIRPGFDRSRGLWLMTTYNYYFSDRNFGSLQYDWLGTAGNGYGWKHEYKLFGGVGSLDGYYFFNRENPPDRRFTGHFKHLQEFGEGYSLRANVDLLSDYRVNNDLEQDAIDVFQRSSYLSLQSSQKSYAWNMQISERQILQPDENGYNDYIVVDQTLPAFSFSRFSASLFKSKNYFWSFKGSASRQLNVPVAETGFYDTTLSYNSYRASISPQLSVRYVLPWQNSFSGSVAWNQYWEKKDAEGEELGDNRGTLGTTTGLQTRWGEGWQTDLSYETLRQLTRVETLPLSGILTNRIGLRVNGMFGETLTLYSTTGFDLRGYQVDDELKRIDLVRTQLNWMPDDHKNLSSSSNYNVSTGQIKTLTSSFSLNDREQRWNFSLGTTWVNNKIILKTQEDPNAPAFLEEDEDHLLPDQLQLNTRVRLNISDKWKLNYYYNYNVTTKKIDNQAVTLWRDLFCWDLQLFVREKPYTGWQFGFALSLKAAPDVQASSNRLGQDMFSDMQFGY